MMSRLQGRLGLGEIVEKSLIQKQQVIIASTESENAVDNHKSRPPVSLGVYRDFTRLPTTDSSSNKDSRVT